MLRFYAYFKQATEGPCTASRPAFWEVVKKMKWDAWNKLGNMSQEEAMNNYVEELKKIVETMSYTDNVATFLGSLGSFYDNVPPEDLELLIGNVIERVRSQPGSPLSGSPFASREASPHRVSPTSAANGRITSSLETSPASSYSASPLPPDPDDDEEDEEFIDTVETEPERFVKDASVVGRPPTAMKKQSHYTNGVAVIPKNDPSEIIANGHTNGTAMTNGINGHHNHDDEDKALNRVNGYGGGVGNNNRGRSRERTHLQNGHCIPSEEIIVFKSAPVDIPEEDTIVVPKSVRIDSSSMNGTLSPNQRNLGNQFRHDHDISDQIRDAVLHLQQDLDRVTSRVRSLEVTALSGTPHGSLVRSGGRRSSWWPFSDLSPRTFTFVVLWPVFVHLAILWLRRRRAQRVQPL
ncbi:hypothetical protein C0J52_10614 [Blattella germanica]|nr:hypothetical protein C0J52_10614 [Blattella germanica]